MARTLLLECLNDVFEFLSGVSACSRAPSRQATTHIAELCVCVDTRLQVLEDGWIDTGHCVIV
jgi:hypothetical protein